MEVKFKKIHQDAITPKRATDGSNGFDLTAISKRIEYDGVGNILYISYNTGLSFAIPHGYVGLLASRSSVSKLGISLANNLGILDVDFRGEVSFRFYEVTKNCKHYNVGERIGQLVVIPNPPFELKEVTTLDDTLRGSGGYGSSGL